MNGNPSNTFSWRHTDDVPYHERTSPAENRLRGGSDDLVPLATPERIVPPTTHSPFHRQVTPQGVLVTSDRDGDDVPLVEGTVLSPSQTMAKVMNDSSLEPSIWLSLASSVEERPVEKGWYVGESNIPEDSPEGFTVRWVKLTSQDIIEDAFLSPNQKSVMVYGQRQDDDIKINFEKFYAKRRGGVSRRPVVRIGSAADPGYSNDMLNGLGIWEFNYENEANEVTSWEKFDRSDCELFDLCAQAGRSNCVIYDGNSAIAATLFPTADVAEMGWANILWRERCGVEKSKGYIRRREVGEEGQDDQWALGVEGGGIPTSSTLVAAVTTTARFGDDEDSSEDDGVMGGVVRAIGAVTVDQPGGISTGVEVNMSIQLGRIVDMGFEEGKCLQALYDNGGNVERAIEQLLRDS